MKVYIGKYTRWIGPFQLADLLTYVGVSEDITFKIGEWLSRTWVNNFCNWFDSKKKRKIKVRIDDNDVWSLDHTLALVILPALQKFRSLDDSMVIFDKEDIPESIAEEKEWQWILDEMIYSFQEIVNDNGWDQFTTGSITHRMQGNELILDDSNYSFDEEGYKKYNERVKNGLRLFGKYYQNLWC